jgi:hypothetical protein
MLLMPIDARKLRTGVAWLMAGALLAMMPLTGGCTRRGVRLARRTAAPTIRAAGLIVSDVRWVEVFEWLVGVDVAEYTEESVPG